MRLLLPLLACCLLACTTALASDADDTLVLNAKARVAVDAEGRVTDVAFVDAEKLISAVREPLDRAIRSWAFEPARKGDRAVSSETTVKVGLRAERLGDEDAFVLSITSASAGPDTTVHQHPRYPVEAVRARISGRVVVRVHYDADGVPTDIVTEEAEYDRNESWHQARAIEKATHEAVRSWRFQPEIVDGQPLASSVLVPMTFCVKPANSKYRGCFKEEQASFPDGTLLAEQPATRLLTEVVGTRL